MNRYRSIFLYCTIILLFGIPASQEAKEPKVYKYQLSITAIFRDDARFLREWIEFHRMVGVEHFYLYNNLSKDDYQSVLKPYIQEGLVELIHWPRDSYEIHGWSVIQNESYTDALKRSRGKTKWLAIIDTDEFLFPVQHDDLVSVLNEYDRFGGVGANWQMFGTSNVQRIPEDGLMIENLLMRAEDDYSDHNYVKSIVRPERVVRCGNPHFVLYQKNYFSVNENKQAIKGRKSPYVSVNKLRINHYWTRDEDFFHDVKLERERKFKRNLEFCTNKKEEINQVYDDVILRFVPELNGQMFVEEVAR